MELCRLAMCPLIEQEQDRQRHLAGDQGAAGGAMAAAQAGAAGPGATGVSHLAAPNYRTRFGFLLATTALVLLTACANLAVFS